MSLKIITDDYGFAKEIHYNNTTFNIKTCTSPSDKDSQEMLFLAVMPQVIDAILESNNQEYIEILKRELNRFGLCPPDFSDANIAKITSIKVMYQAHQYATLFLNTANMPFTDNFLLLSEVIEMSLQNLIDSIIQQGFHVFLKSSNEVFALTKDSAELSSIRKIKNQLKATFSAINQNDIGFVSINNDIFTDITPSNFHDKVKIENAFEYSKYHQNFLLNLLDIHSKEHPLYMSLNNYGLPFYFTQVASVKLKM